MNVLTIQDLSKSFGKQKVIDSMSLSVPEGSIFGFIGKNGAGKTTAMKMVLGLLQPDSGKIHVCGEPVCFGQTRTNRLIGYLPDVPEFYNYMTPKQYLKLCGEVIGLPKTEIAKRSQELLSLVGLYDMRKPIGGFSRGMKQRLGIAQALLTQPRLLICDEPTSALDPIGRKEILDILHKISGTTTVLFSTHILSDVERICDHAAFLHEGKIAVSGTLAEMKALHGHDSLLLEFSAEKDLQLFKKQKPAEPLLLYSEENNRELILHSRNMDQTQKSLFHILAETGICPVRIELMEPSNMKNYRFLILFAVFLIFGMMSAFLAKFTPEILSALAADMEMTSEPTALDAWKQFYKNISGIGFSAFIILFGSCLSNEYSGGTLVLMVTKGLSRKAVILAKYTAAAALMTISYWVGYAAAYGYTALLWNDTNLSNVALAAFSLWAVGFLYLSILMVGCVLFRQTFTSILFTGGMVALISLLGMAEPIAGFNPFILTSKNIELISGEAVPSEFIIPAFISVVLSVCGLLIAIRLFDKKQL